MGSTDVVVRAGVQNGANDGDAVANDAAKWAGG